ncbi:AMP-binding protein [Clostridiaceae bacterium M8S5]|nr:AMP-binding protein [Clostridiaceae bacterium M8S5]
MKKTILDYFESTVEKYPLNTAVGDKADMLTYSCLMGKAKSIGTAIAGLSFLRKPVAILMKRGINVPSAMLGVLYSGNFYVVLDSDSPKERLQKIIDTLSPVAIVYETELKDAVDSIYSDSIKIHINGLDTVDEVLLGEIRRQMLSTDPAYSIFTSGSTGFPKGALLSNQNVISYIDWFTSCFDITSQTVFGSQTPLYFSMSVSDMYASFWTGAAYQMIPKEYFTFPIKLVEFMNEKEVNTIYWVPSALGIASKMDLFKYAKPKYIKKILFAGEVMPVKYLNYWRKYFQNALYANLFGPTETTDICAYYIVDRQFEETETLPIGNACKNCRLIHLDENNQQVADEMIGELFVSGPFVASGYYNNNEKTKEVFVQNPLQSQYPETVYKTGDLVRKNKYGEFEYCGRKDFQIKHMGYRIELGEIEAVFGLVDNIGITVCIYDSSKDELILVYEGHEEVQGILRETADNRLPHYMRPDKYFEIDVFPKNANGKIDRKKIQKIITNR